jgi:hypothetical protein
VGALTACGDSGSNTADSSSTSKEASSQPGSKESESKSDSKGSKKEGSQSKQGDGSGESNSRVHVVPLKVSGGGSTQFRNPKGGDNSVQDFGEESSGSELEEAADALHGFFVARAEEDWRKACSLLSKTVAEQLKQLGSRSKPAHKGCPATLAALTPPLPPAVQRESTMVDAGSLRVEGERGFLIYRGAEETVYAITMAHEGDSWKVGSLAPVPLQ